MVFKNVRTTERISRLVPIIQDVAKKQGHNFIYPGHILLGILDLGEGSAWELLKSMQINETAIRFAIERAVPPVSGNHPMGPNPISVEAQKVFDGAKTAATLLQDEYIGTEHILLALVNYDEGLPAQILRDMGFDLPPENWTGLNWG